MNRIPSTIKGIGIGIIAGSVAFQIPREWFMFCKTTGPSMMPTVDEESLVLVDKRKAHVQDTLKRGDVVLCRSVQSPKELHIKRVTAMQGDRMPESIEPINRFLRYADHLYVPLGYIWVSGDNIEESHDSRHYGPVPLALVEGRVLYQLRPTFRDIGSTV